MSDILRHKGSFEVQDGFGLPRKTTAQRLAYTPPQSGYEVYDTDLSARFEWDGAAWVEGAKQASVDEKVSLAGDTMTGALVLSGDPVNPLEAATRQYVLATAGNAGASELNALTDVTIATPATGHVLVRDATDFKNRLLLKTDVSDFVEGDYATAAQGALADTAVQRPGDTMTGSLLIDDTASDLFVQVSTTVSGAGEEEPGPDVTTHSYLSGRALVIGSPHTATEPEFEATSIYTDVNGLVVKHNSKIQTTTSLASEIFTTTVSGTASTTDLLQRADKWQFQISGGTGVPELEITDTVSTFKTAVDSQVPAASIVRLRTLIHKEYLDLRLGDYSTTANIVANYVALTGDQTVAGLKTFSDTITLSDGATPVDIVFDNGDTTVVQSVSQTFSRFSIVNKRVSGVGVSTFSGSTEIDNDEVVLSVGDDALASRSRLTLTQQDAVTTGTTDLSIFSYRTPTDNLIFEFEEGVETFGFNKKVSSAAITGADLPNVLTTKFYVDQLIAGTASSLDDLTDVDTSTTAPVAQDALFFDGTNFVNRSAVKGDVSDFTETDYVHTTGAETIAGAKTFSDDMVINGSLDVTGTLTSFNSTDTEIADNKITLNSGETGAGVTLGEAGFCIDRGTADDACFTFIEADDTWKVGMLGGPQRALAVVHTDTFLVADWVTVGGVSTLSVPQTAHALAISPVYAVTVVEAGAVVSILTEINATTGEVILKTTGAPFDGAIRIAL